MATDQRTRPFTYDDLRRMPDDGNRYEIMQGELRVSPAPSIAHQLVAASLYDVINDHARRHRLGRCLFAPVDVMLSPFDVVEPDLLFLKWERLAAYTQRGLIEEPPDLVVEIISPSSSSIDPIRKAALYARAGVPEYWLADPEHKTFRLLVLQDDGIYRDAKPVDGHVHSTVIYGLVIDPATLFADLD